MEFATSKVISCQMHYKNDVNRASLKISDSYKDVFKNICHEMCSITTVAEYNDRKKWLEEIANIFPQITSWINWWDARKYHTVPAFRRLGYSNVTLAESGNSTLKWHTQLWLLEAACDDTSTMLTQIHEVKLFLTQQTASSSRGPCSLSCEMADIETQICAARGYAAEFNNNDACSAALQENTNPQVFIPSSGARHRPVKTNYKHTGSICTKKETKEKKTVKKTSHIGLAHQITVAEAILAKKEVNYSPQVPPKDNVPEVVLMDALGIRRCHGCKGEILKQNCQHPKDLVFQLQALQIWRTKGWQDWQQCYRNVYFHLKSHACSYTTINLQLNVSPWLQTYLHYCHKTTCASFGNRTC